MMSVLCTVLVLFTISGLIGPPALFTISAPL